MIYMSKEQIAHLVRDQVVVGSNPITPTKIKPCKSLINNDLQGFLILYLQMMYFRFFLRNYRLCCKLSRQYPDNIPTEYF